MAVWPCEGHKEIAFRLSRLATSVLLHSECVVAVREESGLHLEFCQRGATAGTKSFWSSLGDVVPKICWELFKWGRHAPGALDGALAINTGNRVSLNEQQVADCVTIDSTCNGQALWTIFRFCQQEYDRH